MDLLKVRNTHQSKPLVLTHDAMGNVTIMPGKERIVPLPIAVVNFGNPGAKDDGRNQNRQAEIKHVYTYWGYYPGMHSDSAWNSVGTEANTGKEIGPLCPSAECYDLDDNRVWMIHDDPAGDHASSAATATISDSLEARTAQGMQSQIDVLNRQIKDLLAAQGVPVAAEAPAADSDDGPDVEAMLAEAMKQTQAERNAQRDEIPQPPADESVAKDKPRAPRSGSRTG